MRRRTIDPRPDWQRRVESHGLLFHTPEGVPYWDESACYHFRSAEIDRIEEATNVLHELCLQVAQQVIDENLFGLFLIPESFRDLVVRSWEQDEPSIYGRFDFAYDGIGPPKLLEYNADTPTALVEAAVAQWYWLKDIDDRGDQFNSIHDKLLDAWKALRERDPAPIHFAAMSGQIEDYVTIEYLRDTAIQAGFETDYLDIEMIGWDARSKRFVDRLNRPIERLFKLYPWEWLTREQFGPNILLTNTRWTEPAWKMLLSCKSILPLLWERFPDCPYLLEASFEPLSGSFVKKPIHAREGANIQVVIDGREVLHTQGQYDESISVYQRLGPLKPFDGRYPVIGSWVVNGESCGIGIREDGAMVTQNTSRFVPHEMSD